MRSPKAFLCALLVAVTLALPGVSRADGQDVNRSISGAGTIIFLAAGVGLPLVQDGDQAKIHALRALDSLFVAAGVSEGLKKLTHVRRPDNSGDDSFPSLHASTAFAVATMQAQYHPWEAPLWYAGAAAISISRVQLHKHHWSDVIGGAVIGYGVARLELSSHRGLLLYPFLNEDGGYGLVMTQRF